MKFAYKFLNLLFLIIYQVFINFLTLKNVANLFIDGYLTGYISAEINAEILTIFVKSRRNISPPKIISAEYLSPPNIYLRRKLSDKNYVLTAFFHTMELHLPNSTVKLE